MSALRHYAGVGSRRLPIRLVPLLRELAAELERRDWTLRSGGARGSDAAFEAGVAVQAHKQIFYPDRGLIPRQAFAIAEQHHPAWKRLSGYAKRCHARNSQQVLGPDLNEPSAFVLCWTPDTQVVGGTGQTIRVAHAFDIEVYNIANEKRLKVFVEKYLQGYTIRANTMTLCSKGNADDDSSRTRSTAGA